ncbi:VirK/YbjX family protein [Parashewanella tropica]|uniref:VirK/YbjX family protein n=1 Tax=Parashewanella tropica TaxID=2547970 RepID=UPI00105A0EA7|nr:VirK/YbjX family protein [Parashewanella tropica]
MALLYFEDDLSNRITHLSKANYYQRKPLKRLRLLAWCYLYRGTINAYLNHLEQLNLLWLIDSHPLYIEKPLKPYGCLTWSKQQRLTYLEDHFSFVHNKLGNKLHQVYSEQGLVLFDVQDRKEQNYSVKLYQGEEREGSMGLILTNTLNQTIYSLSFTIYGNDKPCLHIGNVQGANDSVENRSKVIVELTRTCFGLRPKALILEVLLMLARHWGVEQVTGVSNKGHIYQAMRYTGSKKQSCRFNYDQFWQEYEGTLLNKHLYQIPTSPKRKCLDDLSTSKRSMYKKRYQWLEQMEIELSTLTK